MKNLLSSLFFSTSRNVPKLSHADETEKLLPGTLPLRNLSLKLKWIDRFSQPDFENIPSVLFARLPKLNQSFHTVTKTQTLLTLVGVAAALLIGPRLLLSPKKVS